MNLNYSHLVWADKLIDQSKEGFHCNKTLYSWFVPCLLLSSQFYLLGNKTQTNLKAEHGIPFTTIRSSRWQVRPIKRHEIKSVWHLHCRHSASSENEYCLFKCDQETREAIGPWQWCEMGAIKLGFSLFWSEHEWAHYGLCFAGGKTSVRQLDWMSDMAMRRCFILFPPLVGGDSVDARWFGSERDSWAAWRHQATEGCVFAKANNKT